MRSTETLIVLVAVLSLGCALRAWPPAIAVGQGSEVTDEAVKGGKFSEGAADIIGKVLDIGVWIVGQFPGVEDKDKDKLKVEIVAPVPAPVLSPSIVPPHTHPQPSPIGHPGDWEMIITPTDNEPLAYPPPGTGSTLGTYDPDDPGFAYDDYNGSWADHPTQLGTVEME